MFNAFTGGAEQGVNQDFQSFLREVLEVLGARSVCVLNECLVSGLGTGHTAAVQRCPVRSDEWTI